MPPYQNYPYSSPYAPTNYMQRAYAPQTPQMAQPQQQAQVQPQMQMPMAQQMPPMEMPIQDIKYVNRAQAEAYIVFPNTKVMLIDKESGIAYVKTADGMGQTQTDYFRFDRVNADGSPIKPQEPTPQVNFDDYIKREDLVNFGFATVEQVKSLAESLEQMKKRLEGVKPNGAKPTEARM
jgi:hypothetical protein